MSSKEHIVKISLKGFNERQKEVALDIIDTPVEDVKYFVIRASRKAGKTWMLMRLLLYCMVKYPKSEIGMMSASWSFTSNFYRDFVKIIPEQLIKKSNIGSTVELTNGSICDFYTANSIVLPVNRTFDFLFLDEFALYKKDVWTYIKPTVLAKKDAKVIVTSTPRGKNAFYDMCMAGIEGRARHKEYRMHYTDNPKIDMQDIEDARLMTPKQLFDQEYEAMFTDGVSGVFGDFKKCLTLNTWPDFNKDLTYFFGLDISGVGDDKTVLTIMDHNGAVHLIYEAVEGDLVLQANELIPIIQKYNASGYAEKNGIGQGLADILKSKQCDARYWNTSQKSKQVLVTGLIVNINKNEIKLPVERLCPKLENEMSCYGGKRRSNGAISYNGEDGVHDDYVISLMLANEARKKLSSGLQIYSNEDEDEIAIYVESTPAPVQSMLSMIHNNASWTDNLKYD